MIKAHFGAGRFDIAVVFEREDVFYNEQVDVYVNSSHSKMFSFTFLVLQDFSSWLPFIGANWELQSFVLFLCCC